MDSNMRGELEQITPAARKDVIRMFGSARGVIARSALQVRAIRGR
jgi:hypothetical protein